MNNFFEIKPFGMTFGVDAFKPVLLFREEKGERVVAVSLAPSEAGFETSTHALSYQALEVLGVKATRCDFVEQRGEHQFVRVKFEGSEKLTSLKLSASEAVSFCLYAKVPFFCSQEFFEHSRDRNSLHSALEIKRPDQRFLN